LVVTSEALELFVQQIESCTTNLQYSASDSVVFLRDCELYKFTYLLTYLLTYNFLTLSHSRLAIESRD